MKRSIGIIGFGQFGRFVAAHLAPHATVLTYDTKESVNALLDVCSSDLVLFAVPAQDLESACKVAAPHVRPTTLVADVCSVKVRPLETLQTHFPTHEILGTHPIFGPQSGKSGIKGLPLVLCNVSWTTKHYLAAKHFLTQDLGLTVIEKTPEEHDKEMARVQGLAHFIGRALLNLNIQDYDTSTASYHQLVELRDLLKDDSWELFKTIQNENPYAREVRAEFLETLASLEAKLKKD